MSGEGVLTAWHSAGLERWEYRLSVIGVGGLFGPVFDGDKLTTYLNEAGGEGWELVGIVDLNRLQGGTAGLLVTLKRRKRGKAT